MARASQIDPQEIPTYSPTNAHAGLRRRTMKTMTATRTLTVVMTALMLSGALVACKSKKKAAEAAKANPPDGETEVKVM